MVGLLNVLEYVCHHTQCVLFKAVSSCRIAFCIKRYSSNERALDIYSFYTTKLLWSPSNQTTDIATQGDTENYVPTIARIFLLLSGQINIMYGND